MSGLAVKIDHVAALREAKKSWFPDPVAAAVLAELAGADGIVAHLREDRRDISDRDVRILRQRYRANSSWRWRQPTRWSAWPWISSRIMLPWCPKNGKNLAPVAVWTSLSIKRK